MRFSRAAQYGILAMAQLKADGDPVPCSELAKLGNMPDRYLLQVMRQLVNAGLVQATRGCDGGYRLAKVGTTVDEIVTAIDGPTQIGDFSLLIDNLSKKATKRLVRVIADADEVARDGLERLYLSDLSVAS